MSSQTVGVVTFERMREDEPTIIERIVVGQRDEDTVIDAEVGRSVEWLADSPREAFWAIVNDIILPWGVRVADTTQEVANYDGADPEDPEVGMIWGEIEVVPVGV